MSELIDTPFPEIAVERGTLTGLENGNGIIALADGRVVALPLPAEPSEADLEAALDAFDAAQLLPPPAAVAPVPQEVGPAQLRVALIMSGVASSEAALDALVTPIIDGIADPTEREIARVLWTRATAFKRSYPLIEAARIALGWTPAQVDDLFRLAVTI